MIDPTVVARGKRFFEAARTGLEILWHARGGGRADKALAAVSALGAALDAAYPEESNWSVTDRLGLALYFSSVSGIYGSVLRARRDGEVVASSADGKVLVWRDEAQRAVCGVSIGSSEIQVLVKPGEGEDRLSELLQSAWEEIGPELQVSMNQSNPLSAAKVLIPVPPPGPYIGERSPEFYADRLRKYPPGPRTVVFRGPSGVGKTVLARRVSQALGGENSRTLKITPDIFAATSPDEILSLIRMLRPTILLFEDLDLSVLDALDRRLEHYLTVLEAVRDGRCMVLITMMTPATSDEGESRGRWYHPGMRPGRIDEVFEIQPPGPSDRREILRWYAQRRGCEIPREHEDEIVRRSEGLTGAYLANFIERVATHGVEHWREELTQVLRLAPPNDDPRDFGGCSTMVASAEVPPSSLPRADFAETGEEQ